MNAADDLLKRIGLSLEDLDKPGHMGEKEAYFTLLQQSQTTPLTIEDFRKYFIRMRMSVEQELASRKAAPQSFVSLLSYLIPVIGLIRKWYQDQEEIELKARLRNYLLLETFLYSPGIANQKHQGDINDMVSGK